MSFEEGTLVQGACARSELCISVLYNEILVISDGTQAVFGTLTTNWEQFTPWHTIDGEAKDAHRNYELEVLIQGIFDKRRFLDLVKYFIPSKVQE